MPNLQKPAPQINYAGPDIGRRPGVRRSIWLMAAIAIVLVLLLASFLQPSLNSRGGEAPRPKCANNLRQIGLACLMYANEHSGQYPDSLSTVLRDEDITSGVFVCPSSNDTPAQGPTTQAIVANLTAGGHLSYIYVGKRLTTAASADTVLAYEPLTNHGGDGMEVLYADGHVEFQIAVTARKIIAELQAGHNPPRAEKLK
jgi:prepilin-type processing-associated H-X9-DG protein